VNTRRFHPLLWAIFFVLVEFPAHTCGPDWPEAVFIKKHGPDAPYDAFVRGRLGVPQTGYRTRHLVIIYRYLSGLPLSSKEQSAAVKANDRFNSTWDTDQQNPSLEHAGFLAWIDARKGFGSVDGFIPQNPFGTESGWQFDSYFENCLDDAFSNAARTLRAREAAYGSSSAEVVEWVRGQDAVFRNCDKQKLSLAALPASASQWLRYDRTYQQAAALLYQGNFDEALSAFSAIAADPHSPWSTLSRYLVGRVMVTRAVELEDYYPPPGIEQSKVPSPDQRRANYLGQLRAARAELLAMRGEPRMQPLVHAIDAMVDRVNARLEPERQVRILALRLTASAPDPNFYQDVLDLSFLMSDDGPNVNDAALSTRPGTDVTAPTNTGERRAADMVTWIKALRAGDESAILQHWNSSHTSPWLLAALTFAKPGDPTAPELLQAAAKVSRDEPAYPALMYHRLRLLPSGTPTRDELLAVLAQLSANESVSTHNLFAELNARSAPDLQTWLRQAARTPAAEATYGEEDAFDNKLTPQPCGPSLRNAATPLFAPDVATVLNTRLPLRLLAEAAESPILPPNLRIQVAQATWTRAVLLDQSDVAARLSPILIHCNANWEPVLSTYNRAKSSEDRKAAALFALMRFPSTEPNVREGNYRFDGFAAYSYYRDNWWCFTIPPTQRGQGSWREQYDDDAGWGFTSIAHPDVPDPAFLTPADRAVAAKEITALRSIPKASDYLPAEAFAWQRAHPRDPRSPELLGQAFRIVRNACAGKASTETEHRLFLTLHREYPTNHWTLRYRSWE
jgi:hypothetical protein